MENVVADHLSRLIIAHNTHNPPIFDEFPEESLLIVSIAPWYAHIANFFVTGELASKVAFIVRMFGFVYTCVV